MLTECKRPMCGETTKTLLCQTNDESHWMPYWSRKFGTWRPAQNRSESLCRFAGTAPGILGLVWSAGLVQIRLGIKKPFHGCRPVWPACLPGPKLRLLPQKNPHPKLFAHQQRRAFGQFRTEEGVGPEIIKFRSCAVKSGLRRPWNRYGPGPSSIRIINC